MMMRTTRRRACRSPVCSPQRGPGFVTHPCYPSIESGWMTGNGLSDRSRCTVTAWSWCARSNCSRRASSCRSDGLSRISSSQDAHLATMTTRSPSGRGQRFTGSGYTTSQHHSGSQPSCRNEHSGRVDERLLPIASSRSCNAPGVSDAFADYLDLESGYRVWWRGEDAWSISSPALTAAYERGECDIVWRASPERVGVSGELAPAEGAPPSRWVLYCARPVVGDVVVELADGSRPPTMVIGPVVVAEWHSQPQPVVVRRGDDVFEVPFRLLPNRRWDSERRIVAWVPDADTDPEVPRPDR